LFWFGDVTREGEMDWYRGRASGAREQSKTFRKDVLRTWAQLGKISLSWIDDENGAGGRLEQWRHDVLFSLLTSVVGLSDVECLAACQEMFSDEHGGYRDLAILSSPSKPLPRPGRSGERASARRLAVEG
jgi:hypothetical protein